MGMTFYPVVAGGMPTRAHLRVNTASTAQSFTTGVATTVGNYTVVVDNYNKFSGGNTYTIPVTGYYTISAGLRYSSSAIGLGAIAALTISVNGGALISIASACNPAVTASLNGPTITTTLFLNAGVTITLSATQTSGNTLTLSGFATDNWWTIIQVD